MLATHPHRQILIALALATLTLIALPVPKAGAAVADLPNEFFTSIPFEAGTTPRGIDSSPETGHIFVAEIEAHRVGEYTAWGEFVKTWGWDVAPEGAPGDTPEDEFEICTEECQSGVAGDGAGQFTSVGAIAVDSEDNVYTYETDAVGTANRRVQKFAPTGQFELMIGGQVNKTTLVNVCTAADLDDGDECGNGVEGAAAGEFGSFFASSAQRIAVGPADHLWVGDLDRVQEFDENGNFVGQIRFEGELAEFAGLGVAGVTVDASEHLYIVTASPQSLVFPNVYKISPSGELAAPDEFPTSTPLDPSGGGVTSDQDGNVFIIDDPGGAGTLATEPFVRVYDASGDELIGSDQGFERSVSGAPYNSRATMTINTACGAPTFYISGSDAGQHRINVYGPVPDIDLCPPPVEPPDIEAQYALRVGADAATVRAEINPRFWNDTTYLVQYGTKACADAGWEGPACEEIPARQLTEKVLNASLRTEDIFLGGLEPETTYHYRFVAQSSGSAGQPVHGEERSFTTFGQPDPPPSSDPCVNAIFRTGPSAALPDCRAYEQVTPLEKGSADIGVLCNSVCRPASLNQAAPSGERLTYSTVRGFGDPASAPYSSQYLAARDPGAGWGSTPISPPREGPSPLPPGEFLDLQYHGFSEDLCQGWLRQDAEPVLDPIAPPGFANLYRRPLCGGGGYEALIGVAPPKRPPLGFLPELQGFSADGSREVFRVAEKLTPDAPELDAQKNVLYERLNGNLRLLSVLPNGTPCMQDASAGSASGNLNDNRSHRVAGAVSANGRRIYFSCGGKLFLRLDETPEVEGDEMTLAVSPGSAEFLAASESGSDAIYLAGSNIFRFELEAEGGPASTLIATGVKGLMGASEDVRRLYLVSTGDLDGAGEAEVGANNLYLHEGGEFTLVAAVSDDDAKASPGAGNTPLGTRFPSLLNEEPYGRGAQVSPDGLHAAFMSNAPLTGRDNADAEHGEPNAEVFLYDAVSGELRCVSCNPTGARPAGRNLSGGEDYWAAAQIPGWQSQHQGPRVLSEDGDRLFFESFQALVLSDTNGRADVYQWEAAGAGDCTESQSAFSEQAGGCIRLISSGRSSVDSKLIDASADGRDVFFTTAESLLVQDSGLVDVYDARIGGGFPPPPVPRTPCEGEACQSPPSPPADPTPASSTFFGPGDESTAPKRPRCPKGKRRAGKSKGGKARCVKPKAKKKAQRKRAKNERRAAR